MGVCRIGRLGCGLLDKPCIVDMPGNSGSGEEMGWDVFPPVHVQNTSLRHLQ